MKQTSDTSINVVIDTILGGYLSGKTLYWRAASVASNGQIGGWSSTGMFQVHNPPIIQDCLTGICASDECCDQVVPTSDDQYTFVDDGYAIDMHDCSNIYLNITSCNDPIDELDVTIDPTQLEEVYV